MATETVLEQKMATQAELESAFTAFNQLTRQLTSSYQALEQQVERLTCELAAARDDRVQQQGETQRLTHRLERLLQALPAGVVVLDGRGVVQDCNLAAVELLGEPLRGALWREIIVRAFAPQFDDGHEVSLRDGRRVSISSSTLAPEPGQILLIKDVTETRALQEKLSRHQRLSAMGQMAAALAHQIRTPTAAALLYVSQLSPSETGEAVTQRLAAKIKLQLQQIERMVSDMLLYARGGMQGDVRDFFMPRLLTGLEQMVQPMLQQAGAELIIDNSIEDVLLHGNPEALVGALTNLVENSIQARESGAVVTIQAVRVSETAIEIRVKDNGPGMAAGLQSRIFEPFFTTRPQGTGLGLAVVQSVARKHHGVVCVETAPGKGAEFVLRLPIIKRVAGGNRISLSMDETGCTESDMGNDKKRDGKDAEVYL